MAVPTTTIDALPLKGVADTDDGLIIQDSGVTKRTTVAGIIGLPIPALTDHIADADGAHNATAIAAAPSGVGVDAATVQGQLGQLATLIAGGTVSDTVWVGDDPPVDDETELWWDTDAFPEGGSGELSAPTVDTGEMYRIIMFSDGTVRAIPDDATAPATPTGLARTVRINSVRLTWDAVVGATGYRVYRDGTFLASTSVTSYRDAGITVGATYSYAVQAVNVYTLRSNLSDIVTAFVDPALNVAPTVEVRTWPTTIALGGSVAIVRVNALDVDAQLLALTLGTDVGSLAATADPSVWLLTPS